MADAPWQIFGRTQSTSKTAPHNVGPSANPHAFVCHTKGEQQLGSSKLYRALHPRHPEAWPRGQDSLDLTTGLAVEVFRKL